MTILKSNLQSNILKSLIILFFLIFLCSCATGAGNKVIEVLEGDCADRVVQIKKILKERGYETQVVIGIFEENETIKGHAYVKYRAPGENQWKIEENWNCCKFMVPSNIAEKYYSKNK